MNADRPSKWRARVKRKAALLKARTAHGESIKQLWADSSAALSKHEAARAGEARVPAALRVDRPEPEVLVEAGSSTRAWFRQQQRDAKAKWKREENARRREARALAAKTPQPSRRQRILAERGESS